MKRFLKTLALLVVSLFILVTGVDAALEHLSHATAQNAFVIYNEKGVAVLAYEGDLNNCKVLAKTGPLLVPAFRFFHRT